MNEDNNKKHTAQQADAAGIQATGVVTIEVKDCSSGVWEIAHEDPNLVVSQAGNLMAHMAAGTANAKIGYIELGDPVTATAPSLTDSGLEQTTGVNANVTATVSGATVTFVATWDSLSGNGNTYTEMGLFTGLAGSGTMFARKAGFSIEKTSSFELRITWAIRFGVSANGDASCSGIALAGPNVVASDYSFTAVGGESEVQVPIDFTVGAKHLDVFLNGARLRYTHDYIESSSVGGSNKGIELQGGLTLDAADVIYVVHRSTI